MACSIKPSLSLLATAVATWATTTPVASFGFGMAITELTEDLGYVPADECFYPVTFKPHLDAGETDYAFIPHSYLPSDTVMIAPEGAWAYKQNFTTDLAYSKTAIVAVDAPNVALVFGEGEPFMEPFTTFAEVEAAENLTGWQAMARTGIVCTQANITVFDGYSKYAWVSVDDQPDRALGAFVFELADGTGLVRHPDMGGSDEDGPTTDEEEPNTNGEGANTPTLVENSGCVYPRTMAVLTIFALLTNYAIIGR